MITEIRIANFYSIGLDQTISFIKTGKKPGKGYLLIKEFPTASVNQNISQVNGFFGENASGKTNILRAIITLVSMMYKVPAPNQIFAPGENSYNIKRNLHSNFKNQPIKLGANFLFEDNLYKYDVELKEDGEIVSEVLYKKEKQSKLRSKFELIFKRDLEKVEAKPDIEQYLKVASIPSNQTLFSLAYLQQFNFTQDFKDKIIMWNYHDLIPTIVRMSNAAVNMDYNPSWVQNKAKEVTIKAMSLFDKSINGLDIQNQDRQLSIKVKHANFDEQVEIYDESTGTQELFTYIYNIIKVLQKGGIVIFDELNRFLHPDIEKEILTLFLNTDKRSQIFFSSHNHEIMNSVELNQIFLVEKNGPSSEVTQLSDYKDAKSRDNIMKKYRLGFYGAVPDTMSLSYNLNELI